MANTSRFSALPAQAPSKQMIRQVNGNLEFGSNIKGTLVVVQTPGVADTEFIITHNLTYIPTGWMIFSKDQYVDVRKGDTTWTVLKASFKANQPLVNLSLFVF